MQNTLIKNKIIKNYNKNTKLLDHIKPLKIHMNNNNHQTNVNICALFQELGYLSTLTESSTRKVLEQIGIDSSNSFTLSNQIVAQVLSMMTRTFSANLKADPSLVQAVLGGTVDFMVDEKTISWNAGNFVSVVYDMNKNLDFTKILSFLDESNYIVPTPQSLQVILSAAKVMLSDIYMFPLHVFLESKWKHQLSQISFLKQVIQHYPDLIVGNKLLKRKVFNTPTTGGIGNSFTNHPWNCLDLLEIVVSLCEGEARDEAKSLIEVAVQHMPELIAIGLAQTKLANPIQQDLSLKLLLGFLVGHPNSNFVISRMWQISPAFVINGLVQMYAKEPSLLTRALDVAQDVKGLTQVLETTPYFFAIDLAALASRRDYLNLEKWLQDRIRDDGDLFIKSCLEFLREKVNSQLIYLADGGPGGNSFVPLSPDVVGIFLRILQARNENSSSVENRSLLKEVLVLIAQAYPRLLGLENTTLPPPPSSLPGTSTNAKNTGSQFSSDVDEEANSYFVRIYKGEIRITQIIDLLLRYKSSTNQREQDIYFCMIHNLFDEYKFFQRYPEKELMITSILFGSLIQHQVVTGNALGNALRYILDALRQVPGSNLFKFGVQAMSQFQSRLVEWPQYCSLVLSIRELGTSHPEIFSFIKGISVKHQQQQQLQQISGHEQSKAPSTQFGLMVPDDMNNEKDHTLQQQQTRPITPTVNTSITTTGFTALVLDPEYTLTPMTIPVESVQDKILFIINNLSTSNLQTKLEEFKEIFQNEYLRWFTNYIVSKRVSIEPNYHALYINFIDALKVKKMYEFMVWESYKSIGVLLDSDKTVTSSEERGLLKNLGVWLGGLTLAKDKPILHRNLAVKELLLEGYDSNKLIVVIPFVCKVLEQCMNGKVFKPPNPWLMAVVKLLSELYHFADLKLNLKFEIEVLCKNIKLDVKEIQPTNLLRSRPSKSAVMGSNAQIAKNFDRLTIGGTSLIGGQAPVPPGQTGFSSLVSPSATSVPSQEDVSVGYPNLASFITFNPSLPIFQAQPALKRIVHFAIDRAIREIISPVVERSVTIAGIATRELIVKDFALEPDENKMRKSAHLMVASLAGSLASVTSREPLRISMSQNIRTFLMQNGFSEQTIPEQAIFIIVSDNLDLACSVVDKTAAEKSIIEIEEGLSSSFVNRKKHRERTGNPYYDMAVYASSRYPSTLPESLRLKPNGLSSHQLRVYEDFARIPRQISAQEIAERNGVPPRTPTSATLPGRMDTSVLPYGNIISPLEESALPLFTVQFVEKFSQILLDLEKKLPEIKESSVSSLPAENELIPILKQVPAIIVQALPKEEVLLILAQRIIGLLFKHEDQISVEVYVLLLERLCESSKKISKEVLKWILLNENEKKYNATAFHAIIEAKLLDIADLDTHLARLIDSGKNDVVDFTSKLMTKSLFCDPVLATSNDFFNCVEEFKKLAQKGDAPESVVKFVQDLKKTDNCTILKELITKESESSVLREHLGLMFTEWVKSYHHSCSTEKTQIAHIDRLLQQGILISEDVSSLFFRVCTELSVEIYIKNKTTAGVSSAIAFQAVDAFARLIVLVVKLHNDPQLSQLATRTSKINIATKVLSIIVLVLVHSHEQKKTLFNQRPFFRLFSTLLNDIHTFETDFHSQSIYFQILSAMSNTFHTLQPSFLPGFTFSWLQLVSHRHFMSKLLLAENQKGWPFFQRLMIDLFKFSQPFLKQSLFSDGIRLLYKGTLRILLVLLHDFPEFLCSYHFSFMDAIPIHCIQMRNLILSAFPSDMRLPDPFTPNLKVDLLPEIHQSPQTLSDYTSSLVSANLKSDLDSFLKNRAPTSFLSGLKNRLMLENPEEAGVNYNVSLINSLVMHVGIVGISQAQALKLVHTSQTIVMQSAPMDVFQQLVVDFDSEGRYFFLSAIANHLRFPNSHTHYFSCVLLSLFSEAKQEIIQEQITRVLLERLIVNRPHPYGLLITFIELIRNPRFNFWDHSNFIRCAPEIERLFSSVAKSINSSFSTT